MRLAHGRRSRRRTHSQNWLLHFSVLFALAFAPGQLAPTSSYASSVGSPSIEGNDAYDLLAARADLVLAGTLLSILDSIPPDGGPLTTICVIQPVRSIIGPFLASPVTVHIPDGLSYDRTRAWSAFRDGDRSVLVTCVQASTHWALLSLPHHVPCGFLNPSTMDVAAYESNLAAAQQRNTIAALTGRADVVVVGVAGQYTFPASPDSHASPCISVEIDSVIVGSISNRAACVSNTLGSIRRGERGVFFLRKTGATSYALVSVARGFFSLDRRRYWPTDLDTLTLMRQVQEAAYKLRRSPSKADAR